MRTYRTFDSWANLLDAIRAEYRIAYHAPLDVRPIQVGTTIRRDGRVTRRGDTIMNWDTLPIAVKLWILERERAGMNDGRTA